MPGQGVSSTFTFGENIGIWKGILAAMDIPYIETTPQKWQRQVLDFLPTKEGKLPEADKKEEAARLARNKRLLKNSIVEFVRRRFPESIPMLVLQKSQGIADAICLAEFGRRQGL